MAEIFDFGLQQHKIKMDGKFFENNLFAVAGDTGRRLEVQLLDSDNLVQNTTGISLRLNADVAGQATYAEAILVDATKGLYELDLPNGMLMSPGDWQFQWQIIGSTGEKLHSFAFIGSVGINLSEGGTKATNFYLNVEGLKELQEDFINGTIDSAILQTKIENVLTDLEESYIPRLLETESRIGELGAVAVYKGTDTYTNIIARTGMLVGDEWYDSTNNRSLRWNGTSWLPVGNGIKLGVGSITADKYGEDSISGSKLAPYLKSNFGGTVVKTTKGGSYKNGANVMMVYDFGAGNDIKGKTFEAVCEFWAQKANYAGTVIRFFVSASPTTLGTEPSNPSDYPIYDSTKVNTLTRSGTSPTISGRYLQVFIWNSLIDANVPFDFYFRNMIVKINGTVYNPIGSYSTFQSTATISEGNEKLPIALATTGELNQLELLLHGKMSPLKGKIINILGDSLSDPGQTHTNKYWYEFIAERTGAIFRSYGKGGSRIGGTDANAFVNRYNLLDSNCDGNIIYGGVNDHGQSNPTPLGVMSDRTNTTLYGSLHVLIQGTLTKFPNKPLLFITPMNQEGYFNTTNSLGLTLADYVKAIKEVCGYYSVDVCDLNAKAGFTARNAPQKNLFFVDGLHANILGHEKMSVPIGSKLSTLFV